MIAEDRLGSALDRDALDAIAEGRCVDPFRWLGPHRDDDGVVVRAFLPGARRVEVLGRDGERHELRRQDPRGLFEGRVGHLGAYRLRIEWPDAVEETEDPYAFGLLLGELDLHLIAEGKHWRLAECLGAQVMTVDGVRGVRFAVWAPNAARVSVVGDFNAWDGRRHPMRLRVEAGIWELFVPRLRAGARYKFEILARDGRLLPLKADPLARATEAPPATASVIAAALSFAWNDEAWMRTRAARHAVGAPISIYEVHAGSWLRGEGGQTLDWDALGDRLIPYLVRLGFTHVEFLPVTEHPFGGSWGYQPIGLFAPSARFGDPEGFARLVDRCHGSGVGVIVDFVPAHFPSDAHGLARFDGTALYEHDDPREGVHRDWNTLIYNFGRREVQGFLIASALHWLERFHVDGLRVDAVASMLYRDYSRQPGEWVPNREGGRENLEAVGFLRHLNEVVHDRCHGAITIAEESTAWPGVTRPTADGGLGFDFKWNMGWMHDTLRYLAREPVHRRWHHDDLTFGLIYAFSERFVLPLSHDEVVYGKRSLVEKMPGDRWQRFAGLRAYLGFMWTHPGKKLLFMGGEIAQAREWSHDREIDWPLLDDPANRGVQSLVGDLNRLYREHAALHGGDADPAGFAWVIGDDRENSVFAYLRRADAGAPPVLVVVNMTAVPRHGYRIGVDATGRWREILNTDAAAYGGSGVANPALETERVPAHGRAASLALTLPPLATLILQADAVAA